MELERHRAKTRRILAQPIGGRVGERHARVRQLRPTDRLEHEGNRSDDVQGNVLVEVPPTENVFDTQLHATIPMLDRELRLSFLKTLSACEI